jgi:transcriptional regulator with XRE-family HTH domain
MDNESHEPQTRGGAVADGSPTVRRRRLGLILRSLRERAGLTGEEVGAAIERSGSWVSRVETGRVGLRSRDLTDLLSLYRVDDPALSAQLLSLAREGKQRGWWSRFADTLAGPYATYIGFESEAAELLIYETVVINGLLQTEQYARALFGATMNPPNTEDMIERKVKVRMARQELLTRARPLKVWAILDESVLHRRIGGDATHRAQLKHLYEMSLLPNVTIQIVPFDAMANPGMIGSFTIVRFPSADDPDIVYIEGVTGDIFAESEDALSYHEVFDHLRAAALSPTDSRHRISGMWELRP